MTMFLVARKVRWYNLLKLTSAYCDQAQIATLVKSHYLMRHAIQLNDSVCSIRQRGNTRMLVYTICIMIHGSHCS